MRHSRFARGAERSVFNRPRPDLRIVHNAAADEAEVFIYDEIGFWGIQATDFVKELKALDVSTLHVRINSPGGGVFDGIAIANALKEHRAHVVTHIDGLAASIASIIALAGDDVEMADNAFLMIHEPWTIDVGNADQLRHTAGVLDKIGGSLLTTYVKKTGADEAQVKQWMQDETWFTAQEAADHGFIDTVTDASDAEASFDLSVFANAPRELHVAARARRDARPTPTDLERALRDAGLSRSEAKTLLATGYKTASSPCDAAEQTAALDAGRSLLAALAP